MKGLALLAEGSPRVGSGHVVETLNLSRNLGRLPWRAYLNAAVPKALLRRFGRRGGLVRDFEPGTLALLAPELRRRGVSAAVLNFLTVRPSQVQALKRHGIKVACLSVLGPRPEGCDLFVDLGMGRRKASPKYMTLSPSFARLARRPKAHRGPVKELLICMGGTDSSGSTAHLVCALAGPTPGILKHVVQGPNFAHPRGLWQALRRSRDSSFVLHQDPPDLPILMRRCDAAFTLGSDTSLELACLGIPTLLLHETPHEERQARWLASRGCGHFLGSARSLSSDALMEALRRMNDAALRTRLARAGRRLVDGRGAQRLVALLRRSLLS